MTEIEWGGSFSDKDRDAFRSALATLGIKEASVRMVMTCVGPGYNIALVTNSEVMRLFVPRRRKHRSEPPSIISRIEFEDLSQVAYKSRHTRGDDTAPRRLYTLERNGTVSELGLLIPDRDLLQRLAVALDPVPLSVDGELVELPVEEPASVGPSLSLFAPVPTSALKEPGGITRPGDPGALTFFVSHATEDGQAAVDVTSELESKAVGTWLATRDIQVGENYAAQIYDAIVGCTHLLVLLSPASIMSVHVQREVNLALDQGKPLLPIVVSENPDFMVTLPAEWKYWLGVVQVVPYSGPAHAVSVLLRSINATA